MKPSAFFFFVPSNANIIYLFLLVLSIRREKSIIKSQHNLSIQVSHPFSLKFSYFSPPLNGGFALSKQHISSWKYRTKISERAKGGCRFGDNFLFSPLPCSQFFFPFWERERCTHTDVVQQRKNIIPPIQEKRKRHSAVFFLFFFFSKLLQCCSLLCCLR